MTDRLEAAVRELADAIRDELLDAGLPELRLPDPGRVSSGAGCSSAGSSSSAAGAASTGDGSSPERPPAGIPRETPALPEREPPAPGSPPGEDPTPAELELRLDNAADVPEGGSFEVEPDEEQPAPELAAPVRSDPGDTIDCADYDSHRGPAHQLIDGAWVCTTCATQATGAAAAATGGSA